MTFPTTHPALARALAARDYSVPTAVQLAVLADTAAARDLLVSAQTGSGKTVAFGLAMAATLLGEAETFEAAGTPQALIIAPTRELALQVQRELIWLYAETGARIVACVGGMDPRAEARLLNAGAHIVVGTPGRLRDHMERGRLVLGTLKAVVLDEADEMLDLGFREDLEFLLDATPESRRTLMFSATVPREIETLAQRFQRDAMRIETTQRSEPHADIEYQCMRVVPSDVENAVVNILRFHEMRAALVFCSTREAVKRMQGRLHERGFEAVALSGELSQSERMHALQALRDGRARVLVATDVAARGLDLPDLALVIHADLPRDPETLLHRSGRTGRAGKKGLCVLVVPFTLNRKANQLIGATRIKVTWRQPPSPEEIRVRDQERFLADAIFTADAAAEEDLALAKALQAGRTADEIALALVRVHRARLPAPEDLAEDTGPRKDDRARTGKKQYERKTDYVPAGDGGARERGPRPPRPFAAHHEGGREMVWFRLNIGRERNADPRWLLPLICKAGGVTKAEIGSIRVQDRDTRFQIVATAADRFDATVRQNKPKEGHISRVAVHTTADDTAVSAAIQAVAAMNGGVAASAPPAPESAPPTAAPASIEARPKKVWDKKSSDKKYEGDKKPWVKKSWDKTASDQASGSKPAWQERKPSQERKPWQDRAKAGNGEGAADGAGATAKPKWSKPDGGKPYAGKSYAGKPAGAEAHKPAVSADGAKPPFRKWDKDKAGDKSSSGADGKSWAKTSAKPWDKSRDKSGAKPWEKNKRPGSPAEPAAAGSKSGSHDAGKSGAPYTPRPPRDNAQGPRPPSKYQHKKKTRPASTSTG